VIGAGKRGKERGHAESGEGVMEREERKQNHDF